MTLSAVLQHFRQLGTLAFHDSSDLAGLQPTKSPAIKSSSSRSRSEILTGGQARTMLRNEPDRPELGVVGFLSLMSIFLSLGIAQLYARSESLLS
jgi:hypothetical protein